GLTAAAPTAAQVNLTWIDGSSNEDGFAIERATGAGAYAQIATVAANLTSYQDTDPALLPAIAYNYRVRAFSNAAGYSAYCTPATVTTPNPVPAPSGLAATAISSAEIDLTWTNGTTSVDSVRIERKVGPGGTYVEIATLAPTTTFFADTEVTQGTTFYYRVRAYSSTQGSSTYSNEANAAT